ncbi:MAG: helix-turn-helix transcriptional regulator [Clostridia bacterium]|nr:helix-turn-helix transcriptional regulator [Clostridia bacterium]
MSFAENIKQYRTAANLTQEQLASAVGISAQAVSKWETNESLPDTALLPDIADALNVTIDELFGHTPKSMDAVYRTLAAQIHGKSDPESVRKLFDTTLSAFRSAFSLNPVPELKGVRNDRRVVSPDDEDIDSRKFDIVTSDYCIVSDPGIAQAYESKYFPYVSILMEPEDGYKTILDSKLAWDFIHAIGDEDVMKCIRYMLTRNESFEMEASLFLKRTGIDPARKEEVFAKLTTLRCLKTETIEINGQPREIVVHWRGHMARRLLPFFAAAYAASTVNFGNGRGTGVFTKSLA